MVGALPDEVRSALKLLACTRREGRNSVLFRQGEPASGVYIIRSGSVALTLGARLYRTAGRGTILGLPAVFSGQPYSLTAAVVEDCELDFINRETILDFVRSNPSLAMHLLELLAGEVAAMREMANGNRAIH
jgi:CRP/FNR family transcriptional regulator, cyclic AMP receptor protein